mgnify:CR=1 FL=1
MSYTLEEVRDIYNLPFTTLLFRAQEVHQKFQDPTGIQLGTLKSIKTGACSEDCKYCPQSAHNDTGLARESLLDTDTIMKDAVAAKEGGASRFCMGAAWRRVPRGEQFDSLLNTISSVSELGLEVCCTLGTLEEDQAEAIKDAGCSVYNHNVDTSKDYYSEIITTRTYEERIDNIEKVRKVGMEVCSGGIIGMGEPVEERIKMVHELATMDPYPDSVPINALIACKGTPLEDQKFIDSFEFVRIIATARITMPKAMVRLSAGRTEMNDEMQALCFVAGANSIFLGEKLLTTGNPDMKRDFELLDRLGLKPLDPEVAREIHARAEQETVSV